MRLNALYFLFMSLLFPQISFGASCPISSAVTATGAAFNTDCTVTGSASVIQLNFKNGFNDTSVVSASGGNNGTTVGAQRKLSFIKAAEILADKIISSQPILVDADFDTNMACDASTATLGSAGPSTFTGNVIPMPIDGLANTFYPIGLINSLGDTDYQSSLSDIDSSFNSDLGDSDCLSGSFWYYGFDAPSGSDIGFTTVLLHEMTHGLGFSSLVDASSGAKPSGVDDIFSNFLYSAQYSADWSLAGGLTNAQRKASAISTTELLWNGTNVNTAAGGVLTAGYDDADSSTSFTAGDRVEMYAPNPVEGGSSVSHFTTAASPNEIMEPQYTAGQLDLGLALYLLKDIGWQINTTNTALPSTTIEVAGTSYNNGDIFVLSDSNTQIDVNDGTGDYSYSLDYNSADVAGLINLNTAGITIDFPNSGEFAGDYTLTITDNGDGDVITLTLTRSLRLNWSSTSILNGNLEQTLAIEGGAAGTVYSLYQSGFADLIFLNANDVSIISSTADNNPVTFNAAVINLDSVEVTDISSMNVTVQSSYDDVVESDVKVYPSSLHTFSVKNLAGELLINSLGELVGGEALLTTMNIATTYKADSRGEFTVLLPNTLGLSAGTKFAFKVSANGYNSENLLLDSDITSHNLVLTEVSSGIVITVPVDTTSGSAGGRFGFFSLFLLFIFQLHRMKFKYDRNRKIRT